MPDSVRIDDDLLRGWPLPAPGDGGKDERGRILVVAGAPQMPGAAILCATAALRAGAGKLQIATCSSVAAMVGCAVPESLVVALDETRSGAISRGSAPAIVERANATDALVIGPGLVDESASAELITTVAWKLDVPVVVDAAALACFAERADTFAHLGGRAIVTPHAGEMSTMMRCAREEVEREPDRFAREAARAFNAIVVMKGATTFVADPDGAVYRNEYGDPGLATSGSGDVLAGIAGGLLARGVPPLHAACWAVALHARAGEALAQRVGLGFLARELPAEIPPLMRKLAPCAS